MMPSRRRWPRWEGADSLLDAPIAVTLDLHRCTGAEAEARVRSWLASQRHAHAGRVLHIITGKGRGSAKGPVLKPLIRRMLATELRPLVAEFDRDLDEGGFLVRLR